jgi:predicted naringenin-chalcone synthase
MSFHITGVGTSVPRQQITQDDAARLAIELTGHTDCHAAAVRTLYRRTGVETRHSTLITSSTNGRPATQSFFPVAAGPADHGPTTRDRMCRYEQSALELAAEAARAALHDSSTASDEIAHLVTVSCTGFSAPGVDIGLIESLRLNRRISRTHIGFMGCHGALNGLRVASAMSHAAPGSKVLQCCIELCSLHHQYAADPQQVVANALFSDGAAAIVGCADASKNSWRLVDQFSEVLSESAGLMTWQIGDNGFNMRLSPQIPEVIKDMLKPWLGAHLSRHKLSISDVKSWAIHPGGPRILTACAEALRLDHACLEPSQAILADYGNMSSPTVLFILDRLRANPDSLPCVMLAFGPGLSVEAALFG